MKYVGSTKFGVENTDAAYHCFVISGALLIRQLKFRCFGLAYIAVAVQDSV
jgi:hypothetical protein